MKISRVRGGEWIAGACGILILVAMSLPWYDDESAFASVGVLDVILGLAGLGGLLMPLIAARSRYTNVPIVSETLISDLATIAVAILLFKLVRTPDEGLKIGYFLGLAGTAILTVCGWKSVARES